MYFKFFRSGGNHYSGYIARSHTIPNLIRDFENTHSDFYHENALVMYQGGIKSVVWTDAFQFVMIFIGLAAVTIKVGLKGISMIW